MKESGKMRLKSTIYESTLSTADAVPLPRWGRQISSGYAANIYGGDARKSLDIRFPVLDFPNIAHLTANNKDFSTSLEMTV